MKDYEIMIPLETDYYFVPTNPKLYDYSFKTFAIAPLQKEAKNNLKASVSEVLSKNNMSTFQLIKKLMTPRSTELVANLTTQAESMIKSGQWSLGIKSDTGELLGIIRDNTTGQIKSQVTLTEKKIARDLGSVPALVAVQAQLTEISSKIDQLNNNILQVEQGQYNDRYAGFFTGRQLTIEAFAATNPHIKMNLLLEAVKNNTATSSKLMVSIKEDAKLLTDPGLSIKDAERKTKQIETSLIYLNGAVQLNLVAYSVLREQQALQATLLNYEAFVNQTLLNRPNKKEHSVAWFIDNGSSNKEQNMLINCRNISRSLRKAVDQIEMYEPVYKIEGGADYEQIEVNPEYM